MNLRDMVGQMQMGMPSEAPQQAPAKKKGGAASFLKKAHAAHKSGDHKSAKSHAFGFIRALGSSGAKPQPGKQAPMAAGPTGSGPGATQATPTDLHSTFPKGL